MFPSISVLTKASFDHLLFVNTQLLSILKGMVTI
jgi:hypothetical protein